VERVIVDTRLYRWVMLNGSRLGAVLRLDTMRTCGVVRKRVVRARMRTLRIGGVRGQESDRDDGSDGPLFGELVGVGVRMNDDIETPAYPKYSPEHAYALESEVEKLRKHGQSYDAGYDEGWVAGKKRGETKVERLQAHIRSESSRLVQIDASRDRAEAEVERLQQAWYDVRKTLMKAEAEVEKLREENEVFSSLGPSNALLAEVESLRTEVDFQLGVQERVKAEVERLNQYLLAAESRRDKTEAEVERLTEASFIKGQYLIKEREVHAAEIEKLREEVPWHKSVVEVLNEDAERLREHAENLGTALLENRAEVERLRAALKEIATDHERLPRAIRGQHCVTLVNIARAALAEEKVLEPDDPGPIGLENV